MVDNPIAITKRPTTMERIIAWVAISLTTSLFPAPIALEAKDAEQDAAVASANTTAQRAEAMTEQNRSALRALNDKIDRMFKTISRK